MAIVDHFDILSDKQVIDGNCYSDQAKDFGAEMDIGQTAVPQYIKLIADGTHTSALTVQLIGANKADFTDAFVVATTVQIPSADLVAGWHTYLPVPAIGKKYRYLCLKYIPTGGSDSETEKPEDGNYCPPTPVLGEATEVPNGITAFFTTVNDFHTEYPYANADKATL